jgi:DNA-directed RNA polymerase sigma subunit (sigma70/sigma32)
MNGDIEAINNIVRTSRQMLRETGRAPTAEELTEKTGIPIERLRKALNIVNKPILLENPA